jgi:tetratricopeptide (TPR) repeat protein
MKTKWTKIAFITFLVLVTAGCAAAPEKKKTDQGIPEKKEELSQKEELKIEKSEEGKLERSDEKAIKKMAKEIARERGEDFYQTGVLEFNKGDFEDAVVAFSKAVAEDRTDYLSHFGLGKTYQKLDKGKEAAEAFEETVKIKPDYLPAREALGLLYFHQKKFQEAELHLKAARILKSQNAEIYYCLGEIEQREKACRTAIIAFEQALKLNPDYVAARNGLEAARAACRKKQPAKKPKPIQPQ